MIFKAHAKKEKAGTTTSPAKASGSVETLTKSTEITMSASSPAGDYQTYSLTNNYLGTTTTGSFGTTTCSCTFGRSCTCYWYKPWTYTYSPSIVLTMDEAEHLRTMATKDSILKDTLAKFLPYIQVKMELNK